MTISLALVAALLSLLSWSMVASFARQAAERTQDNILAASATIIAEAIRSEGGEVRLELPYAAFAMLGAVSEDRVFYQIETAGEILTGYEDLTTGSIAPAAGEVRFETTEYLDVPLRMVRMTRTVLAGEEAVPVTVSLAQTRNGIGTIAGDLSETAAALSVAFFVLAVALTGFVAQLSLRPLNELAQAVARRGPTDLRPVRRQAPSELTPLIGSLNRFMERLAGSLRRSEEFIAEAAHRVRTPLATVRAQAEVALHGAQSHDDKQRLRQMIRAIDESSRSAGQLLDHATVAYRIEDLSRDTINLAELAASVAAALEPTAGLKDIEIRLETSDVATLGDKVLLESALRNVLDNAIKYSPDETQISLTVDQQGDMACLRICDQGPGLAGQSTTDLTKRFARGATVTDVVGSGLGLTIASEVLQAHGGGIELADNPKGQGACAILTLPKA
ncbi:sensor histidine kinase [Yoonia litorea]|nr:sensor histidine kinase [Yoonia litorea]